MLTHTSRWSHAPGNAVVPSHWQATSKIANSAFGPQAEGDSTDAHRQGCTTSLP